MKRASLDNAFDGELSKVDYSSRAKGFNVRDFLPPRDTVHTREGFQILSEKLSNK
jgi:hypothetical protein